MQTFGPIRTLSPISTSALSRITQSKLMWTLLPMEMFVPMSHRNVGLTMVLSSRLWPNSSSRMAFLSDQGVQWTLNLSQRPCALSMASRKSPMSSSASLVTMPLRARSMKSMIGEWRENRKMWEGWEPPPVYRDQSSPLSILCLTASNSGSSSGFWALKKIPTMTRMRMMHPPARKEKSTLLLKAVMI